MVSGRAQKSTSPGAKSQPSCTIRVNPGFNTEPGGESRLYWRGLVVLGEKWHLSQALIEPPLQFGQLYKRTTQAQPLRLKRRDLCGGLGRLLGLERSLRRVTNTTLSRRSDTQFLSSSLCLNGCRVLCQNHSLQNCPFGVAASGRSSSDFCFLDCT